MEKIKIVGSDQLYEIQSIRELPEVLERVQ